MWQTPAGPAVRTPSGVVRLKTATRAFTLIELLVVIAIIATVLSLVMPSLSRARALAQSTKCMSNVRQVSIAAIAYAHDYQDRLWPAATWADLDPGPVFTPGLMFAYVDYADFVVECPTNKRANSRNLATGPNGFGYDRHLNFDYTMLDETQGAQLGLQTMCAYIRPSDNGVPQLPPPLTSTLKFFRSLPVLIEESTPIYNELFTEGWWGNRDQVTNRHDKGGYIGYIDGSVDRFKQPAGPDPNAVEPGDFEANDLYVSSSGRPGSWWKVSDRSQPYGWINSPRN
jgi:prepilin-type N-terminal cleavage/methylation domain-containing protein